jgi:hypothetical protein
MATTNRDRVSRAMGTTSRRAMRDMAQICVILAPESSGFAPESSRFAAKIGQPGNS